MTTYDRPAENACPHDGWYNGNPYLMIENGTYDDFRFRLVAWVEKGKMTKSELDRCDKLWKDIPLAEKKMRRDAVIADTTPVPVKMEDGKIDMVAKPSDNGHATRRVASGKKMVRASRAKGALSAKNDPIAAQIAKQGGKEGGASDSASGKADAGNKAPGSLSPADAVAMGAAPVPGNPQ